MTQTDPRVEALATVDDSISRALADLRERAVHLRALQELDWCGHEQCLSGEGVPEPCTFGGEQ